MKPTDVGTWSIGEKPIAAALRRAVDTLRAGLLDQDTWTDGDVDDEPPRVERLWRPFEEGRVFLHRLQPCVERDALFHPHPWPSAVLVLDGWYTMALGKGPGMEPPPMTEEMFFGPGASYAMDDLDTWHAVRPRAPTLLVMVTGAPWGRPTPRSTRTRRTLSAEAARELRGDIRRALDALLGGV